MPFVPQRAEVWVGGGLAVVGALLQPWLGIIQALGLRLTTLGYWALLAVTSIALLGGIVMALHGFGVFALRRRHYMSATQTVADAHASPRASDAAAVAHDLIRGLHNNLPPGSTVAAIYVSQYHEALDRAQEAGFETSPWRVPADSVFPRVRSHNYLTGEDKMTQPRVDRAVLMAKMEAALRSLPTD